ncbi:MAG: polyphosphate polymerase domain-containing protein [Spirochaetales bacterium]|nr:polyphosphate polymerase domain-containing protein [Spirochaetales bacterium]
MNEYRYEYKYLISPVQYHLIKSRINPLMDIDANASSERYSVRSLYYDNISKTGYMSKINGLYSRYKYRLRMYQHDPRTLKFEQKLKKGDLVRKHSILLSVHDAQKILKADYSPFLAIQENAIYSDLISSNYMPCLIIDYIREPYVHNPGNIRITFDFDVFSRPKVSDFFRKITPGIPVYDGNCIIMEIKYSNWLPVWLKQIIQDRIGTRQSISKYCLGFPNTPLIR